MESENITQKYEQFQQKLKARQKIRIKLDSQFQAELDMMEYIILSKFEKNSKNIFKQKKNKQCDKLFRKGFRELTDIQKFYYYGMTITNLEDLINQDFTHPTKQVGSIKLQGYSKSYSKIGWKQVNLKLDFDKQYLYIQRQNKLKAYDITHYLLRKSKATEYHSLVLEAVNSVVIEKRQRIYIGFKDPQILNEFYEKLKLLIQYIVWSKIKRIVFPSEVVAILQNKMLEQQQKLGKLTSEEPTNSLLHSTHLSCKNFVDLEQTVVMSKSATKFQYRSKTTEDQKIYQDSINSLQIKSRSPRSSIKSNEVRFQIQQNEGQETFRTLGGQDIQDFLDESAIFRKLLPSYQLQSIQKLTEYNQEVYSSTVEKFKIYSNTSNSKNIKIFIEINFKNQQYSFDKFSSLFCSPEFFKQINHETEQMTVKTVLTSDNCAILYQKNKPYNRLYRSRDFVFIRHQFQKNNRFYIIDKSLEDSSVPPFTTIVRGQMTTVYEIYQENNAARINIDATIQNFGYLKDLQQLNLNIKYFKGFQNALFKLKEIQSKNISPLLELIWPKNSNQENAITYYYRQQQDDIDPVREGEDSFAQVKIKCIKKGNQQLRSTDKQQETLPLQVSIRKKNSLIETAGKIQDIAQSVQHMEMQGEIAMIDGSILSNSPKISRKFDEQGKVIIDQSYIKRKFQILPEPLLGKQFIHEKQINGAHPIWRGNWDFPSEGGLKFINQKQIQDQKGVLKFILSQVARNLVSGKSILNISLPVDIFSSESNLELFLYSMNYAPFLLQPAAKMNSLDRFLNTVMFGMTNSPLYLQMEKPFNPLIGETFQCYINGSPAYAQQISHHPPIAALMLVGRGYRVSAQIESKMKLNINSGTGVNQGVFRILYDDGQEICYICPSGEVSGLAYGDRKFNMIGKAYAWSEKSGLFLQVLFNPNKTFFGKQQKPIDYVQGRVMKVKSSFLKTFIKNYTGSPKKNQIIEEYGKFYGNWNLELRYEDRVLLNYDNTYPFQIQYEQHPLASDSNWRQDIAYRRILSISQAQVWKQKIEIQQRSQRKLKQKYRK